MSDLYQAAQEFKARLLRGDRAAAGDLLRAYRLAASRIEARVAELTAQITEARRGGSIVSSTWLYERDRLARLRLEILSEVNNFSAVALIRVAQEQAAARRLGAAAAHEIIGAGNGAQISVRLGALHPSAVAASASFAADGSPLRQLFFERAGQLAQSVSDELVSGVASGAGGRVIAGRVRTLLGGDLARALTIARTEVLRAYRTAGLETYRAAGIVSYRWLAAKDLRTCLVCLALDGTVYPVRTPMPAHVNCRCTFVPVLADEEAQIETAAEWFDSLSDGAKRQMLGPVAYEAYRAGQISLSDFVGFRQSARWGVTAYRRPLTEIISNTQE